MWNEIYFLWKNINLYVYAPDKWFLHSGNGKSHFIFIYFSSHKLSTIHNWLFIHTCSKNKATRCSNKLLFEMYLNFCKVSFHVSKIFPFFWFPLICKYCGGAITIFPFKYRKKNWHVLCDRISEFCRRFGVIGRTYS